MEPIWDTLDDDARAAYANLTAYPERNSRGDPSEAKIDTYLLDLRKRASKEYQMYGQVRNDKGDAVVLGGTFEVSLPCLLPSHIVTQTGICPLWPGRRDLPVSRRGHVVLDCTRAKGWRWTILHVRR